MIVELLSRLEEIVTLTNGMHYISPQTIKISRVYHLLEIHLASPIYANGSHIVHLLRFIWVLGGTAVSTGITETFIPVLRSSGFRIMLRSL